QADEPMTSDQMSDIFTASQSMMSPYDIKRDGRIIISSINNPTNGNGVKITLQDACGFQANPSRLGNATQTPVMPVGIVPGTDEEVIAAEVFYNYRPVFSSIIYTGSTLYLVSYTRPRNQNLMTDPGAPNCTTLTQ